MTESSGAKPLLRPKPVSLPPRQPTRPKPQPPQVSTRRGIWGSAAAVGILAWAAFAGQVAVRRTVGEFWIAYPDRASLERAVDWIPANHLAWVKLASLQERAGERSQALESLRRAIELQPYDVQSLIAYSLELEKAGDLEQAERLLLRAAEMDRGFSPRWSLANFYLRRGDEEAFWRWVREGVESSPDNLPQFMDLCWRAFEDGDVILERGLPAKTESYLDYFRYLIEQQRFEPARTAWNRIRADLRAGDRPYYLAYVSHLMATDGREAVAVWNQLCRAGILEFDPLDPDEGPFLTNSQFDRPLDGQGFNWKTVKVEGVKLERGRDEDGRFFLQVQLSGLHPENFSVLAQRVPLTPRKRYRLSMDFRAFGLPGDTGFEWAVLDGRTTRKVLGSGPVVSARPVQRQLDRDAFVWERFDFEFELPEGADSAILEFRYRRRPGTVRREGELRVSNLALTASDSPAQGTAAATGQ